MTGSASRGWSPRVQVMVVADLPTLRGRMPAWEDQLGLVDALVRRASELGRSNCVAVMVRDKSPTEDAQRVRELWGMREVTAAAGVAMVVNGRPDLAVVVGAEGVQLPERGFPVDVIRRAYPGLALGRSCHDRGGVLAAQGDGAAWATLAPVFTPISSAIGKNSAMGLAGFRRAVADVEMPVFGLGGVALNNSLEILRVAAIGSLLLTQSPADALESMLQGRRPI